MKRSKNPKHSRKKITPENSEGNKRAITSYDTSKKETSTPQKVREAIEPEGEQAKLKKSK